MKKIRINVLLLISAILFLSQLTGCAMWKFHRWNRFQNTEAGFSVQVPGKPRHFVMSSSSSLNKEEFDQWTVIDSKSNQQFFIITANYEKSRYENMTADELLNKVDRPAIGFLRDAKQINKQRRYDNSHLLEEQEWQLVKRTNHARSRIYIFDGKIIEMIHVYSISDEEIEVGDHFFESLVIE